jgi:hypothetical protein
VFGPHGVRAGRQAERINMIEGVKINLFGEFRVWRDGQPIEGKEWDRQKTRSLLKLLLTAPGTRLLAG